MSETTNIQITPFIITKKVQFKLSTVETVEVMDMFSFTMKMDGVGLSL